LVFSISYLVSTLANIPGGILADRFDRKTIQIVFWCLGALSALIYALASSWQMTIPAAFLYFLSVLSVPATNAYVADMADEQDFSMVFAIIYATIPVTQLIGPGIGGFLADIVGMRPLFLVSFVCYIISTIVLFFIQPQPPAQAGITLRGSFAALTDRSFVGFSALAILLYLYFATISPFIGPYLSERRGLSLSTIGTFYSVAAVGSIILAPIFGRIGDSWSKIGTLALAVLAFSLSVILIGNFSLIPVLAIGFLLRGSFNVAQAMMSAIVAAFAQGKASGIYFGTFGLVSGVGLTLAPALGGWLYDNTSPESAFRIVGVVGFVLAVVVIGPMRWYFQRTPAFDQNVPGRSERDVRLVDQNPVSSAEDVS
jgi:MFS transporter, DHA1 family, multidrug resistance protein